MKKMKLLVIFLICSFPVLSQSQYFHKRGESYEKNVPAPESVMGVKPGERHVTYAEIENYCKILSQSSRNMFRDIKTLNITKRSFEDGTIV